MLLTSPVMTNAARLLAVLTSLHLTLSLATAPYPHVFDVRDYGAVGDGATLNTLPFAKAVDAAASNYAQRGGGSASVVSVSSGVYLTGQVALQTGVYLSVSDNAMIVGSHQSRDYPPDGSSWALIFARSQDNVGIVGNVPYSPEMAPPPKGGSISGDYSAYIDHYDPVNIEFVAKGWQGCAGKTTDDCRPMLVKFVNSSNIVVRDVTLADSAFWTFHLLNCSGVIVDRINVVGDERFPNNDGIDIDSSSNVTLSDSSFNVADDGVCIKSTLGMQPTSNVVVRRCRVRSRSSAIKFGSTTPVDIHDLLFDDIVIWDSNAGLSIQLDDSYTHRTPAWSIEPENCNVLHRRVMKERYQTSHFATGQIFINGTRQWPGLANASGQEWGGWWGSGENIWISTMPRTGTSPAGHVTNITFENVRGVGQNANFLSGRAPGNAITGVRMSNVTLEIDRWPSWNYSHPDHDYRPTSAVSPDLEFAMTDGLFVEDIQDLVLQNVTVIFHKQRQQPYWTMVCFNTSAARWPVQMSGCACSN